MLRSLSVRVLIALVVGLALGAAAAAWGGAGVKQAIEMFESVGGLWLIGLRMTVVPLIFAILVTGRTDAVDHSDLHDGQRAVRPGLAVYVLRGLAREPGGSPGVEGGRDQCA